jgi:hypothetical protein
MKTLGKLQPGKRGRYVTQGGRNGQISRAYVVPRDPRTEAQMSIRRAFVSIAARWRSLTEQLQNAWRAAAKTCHTVPGMIPSSPPTGFRLFTKINCSLARLGANPVDAPPPIPRFPENPVGALIITNAGGVISLKLGCRSAPAGHITLRASAPCSQGIAVCDDYRILGVLPAPVQDSCDVTALYTGRYGSPAAGTKVFVRVNQNIHGWEDEAVERWAIVPAAFRAWQYELGLIAESPVNVRTDN